MDFKWEPLTLAEIRNRIDRAIARRKHVRPVSGEKTVASPIRNTGI